ncbi:secondary thiamine-phosphate synthase enzyme YjbQ [bacterium]|nr:secondary thiamine-phosphate synthase enzyme YjbQ [bacterium]
MSTRDGGDDSSVDGPAELHTATIEVETHRARELVDITEAARAEVRRSGIREGLCALYAQGATAALMIQENDDPELPEDVLDCLDRLVPAGRWRHDRIDDNGAAHIQAGIVGPSEAIPVRGGNLALSRWQNVFLCDFDGPRRVRHVLVTITGR